MSKAINHRWHYFSQIKSEHGDLYAEAERLLGDRRRLAWSRHPNGLLVVSVLRMIAIAMLAVARRLSHMGYSRETPSWRQVAEHFLMELCGSTLDTKAFDTV